MKSVILFFAGFLLSIQTSGQQAQFVSDLYPESVPLGSDPEDFFQYGNHLYFTADLPDVLGSAELWRTDGTTGGTEIFFDAQPAWSSGFITDFVELDGNLYFNADGEELDDAELFVTDGTEAGTKLVRKIAPFGEGSDVEYLNKVNGKLIFAADDDSTGQELWVSDGTAQGTVQLKDINPGSSGSDPEDFVVVGNQCFFIAEDGTHGEELWVTDGTPQGTKLVKDFNPGSSDGDVDWMSESNGLLYFLADDETGAGAELWVSDGTPGGTKMIKDIYPGSGTSIASRFTHFKGETYFAARDNQSGLELWKTDGTEAGTVLVADINSGSSASNPREFYNWNDMLLLFAAEDGSHGREIWKSDGTGAGTTLLKDINPGADDSYPQGFTIIDGKVIFNAQSADEGNELWITDGSTSGTELLKDIKPGQANGYPNGFYEFNGTIFFEADDGMHGMELWKTDGTESGTQLLADLRGNNHSSRPFHLSNSNGTLFMVGIDSMTSGVGIRDRFAVFSTTGTGHIYNGAFGTYSLPHTITDAGAVNGKYLVSGPLGDPADFELGVADGTPNSLALLQDTYAGGHPRFGSPDDFTWYNNEIFFTSENSDSSFWKSDGSLSGTSPFLKDSFSWVFTVDTAMNSLFFSARRKGTFTFNIYKSDGTESGTIRLKDSSYASNFGVYGGKAYFFTNRELWMTDGTPSGTVPIYTTFEGTNSLFSGSALIRGSSDLFFIGDDGIHGRELWTIDPATNYASMITDLETGPSDIVMGDWVGYDGKLVFIRYTPSTGNELWISDGTEAGTKMIIDLLPGEQGGAWSTFNKLVVFDGYVYFPGRDKSGDWELWKTDGTSQGTTKAADINPGPVGSLPQNLTVSANKLYFSAYHPDYGRELWYIDQAVGIEQMVTPNKMVVYPNPSGANITVELTELDQEIQLMDLNGRILRTVVPTQHEIQIDVSNLVPGIFFIKSGNAVSRFIKQ